MVCVIVGQQQSLSFDMKSIFEKIIPNSLHNPTRRPRSLHKNQLWVMQRASPAFLLLGWHPVVEGYHNGNDFKRQSCRHKQWLNSPWSYTRELWMNSNHLDFRFSLLHYAHFNIYTRKNLYSFCGFDLNSLSLPDFSSAQYVWSSIIF